MAADVPLAQVRNEVMLPIRMGDGSTAVGRVVTFDGLVDGREHLAMWLGEPAPATSPPLVRIHSECLTGDVLGSLRCDCGPQLREAIERLAGVGGLLLYLRQEGRGIGLYNKLDAYRLQDAGLNTYQANLALGHGADERDYTVAAQMLRALHVAELTLLSNNPDKAAQLVAAGLLVARVPTGVHLSPDNTAYLTAKARDGAHDLEVG